MARRVGHVVAMVWAAWSLLRVRVQLRSRSTAELGPLPAPWKLAPTSTPWVRRAVRRFPATCLHRSLVLQEWYRAHGDPRDVIIGVSAPSSGFTAHAWLDGLESHDDEFTDLRRLPACDDRTNLTPRLGA